jgi:hypothetical protein
MILNILQLVYKLQNSIECPRTLQEMPFYIEPRLQHFLWVHAPGTLEVCHTQAAFHLYFFSASM